MKRIFLGSVIALGFSGFAHAAGEGFYIGGQAGITNTHNKPYQLQTGTINPNGSVSNPGSINVHGSGRGIGGRFFLGYHINNYFGVEGGFTHYGPTKYKVGNPSPPVISGNPMGDPTINENAFDFVGKGMFPFTALGLGFFGKAGVAVVRTSLAGTLRTTYNPPPPQGSSTIGGNYVVGTGTTNYIRPTAALGASFDLSHNWVTEFTISRVFGGGGFASADLYSLGLSYHFVDEYCGQFLC